MKQFLSVHDVTNLEELLQVALRYKTDPVSSHSLGKQKRLGMVFLNPSLRTRISTQIAAKNLGLDPIVLNVGQDGWALEFEDEAIMNGSTVEHVKEAAAVLGTYFDLLGIRTFPSLTNKEQDYSEHYIKQFVKYAGVPVLSLESATLHPLQSLADLITIQEVFKEKRKPKIVLSWAPHVKALPQCVANSFAQWINQWGKAEFVITHPPGYELHPQFTSGATITHHQDEALKDADFVYVKNWSSYTAYGKILSNDERWMLTNKKLQATRHAKVMHCLPVRRNVELSSEVLDGPNCLVTQQAGNRVWAAQAVLSNFLKVV